MEEQADPPVGILGLLAILPKGPFDHSSPLEPLMVWPLLRTLTPSDLKGTIHLLKQLIAVHPQPGGDTVATQEKKAKAPKKQPVGIIAQLSRDNGTLLITADLGGIKGKTKKGANIYALTPSPVRITHPTIAGLTFMVKVLQRVSNDPPELALLKEQQASLKAKIKAYRETRKK